MGTVNACQHAGDPAGITPCCAQGWPDGDACAKCPGCALKIWVPTTPVGVVSPLPRCCLPFPMLATCHLRLCWLWGKGLAGALLCLPTPRPASSPACWGSWGQCPPSSLHKSINLGKHSQDWGAPSVCPWHCP